MKEKEGKRGGGMNILERNANLVGRRTRAVGVREEKGKDGLVANEAVLNQGMLAQHLEGKSFSLTQGKLWGSFAGI